MPANTAVAAAAGTALERNTPPKGNRRERGDSLPRARQTHARASQESRKLSSRGNCHAVARSDQFQLLPLLHVTRHAARSRRSRLRRSRIRSLRRRRRRCRHECLRLLNGFCLALGVELRCRGCESEQDELARRRSSPSGRHRLQQPRLERAEAAERGREGALRRPRRTASPGARQAVARAQPPPPCAGGNASECQRDGELWVGLLPMYRLRTSRAAVS